MAPGIRSWAWGKLPEYNGFTHEERVRGWQALHWLMDQGRLARPVICCISGLRHRVGYHSENYYDWHPKPLAQQIHFALHQRFRRPHAWQRIVAAYSVSGDEWFAQLSTVPIDLASQLLAAHGPQVADLFARLGIPEP